MIVNTERPVTSGLTAETRSLPAFVKKAEEEKEEVPSAIEKSGLSYSEVLELLKLEDSIVIKASPRAPFTLVPLACCSCIILSSRFSIQ